jgi:hypothetical protein
MKLSKVQQRLVGAMRRNAYRLTWDVAVWKFVTVDNKKYRVTKGTTVATVNRLVMLGVLTGTKPNGNLRLVEIQKLDKLLAA